MCIQFYSDYTWFEILFTLNWAWNGLSLGPWLVLQSLEHWSGLESPKSSIIAAVGEADRHAVCCARGEESAEHQPWVLWSSPWCWNEAISLKDQHFSTPCREQKWRALLYTFPLALSVISNWTSTCDSFLELLPHCQFHFGLFVKGF